MKRFVITMLFLYCGCVAASDNRQANDFYIQGKPIRPSCIAIFNLGAKGSPFITSLDLQACQKSVLTNKVTHQDESGNNLFYLNDKNVEAGSYHYRLLGKTTSGIYVLHTFESGPAGDINDMLLLLKLEQKKIPMFTRGKEKHSRPALIATLEGFVSGGDRCSGGIKSVSIDHYNIQVEQYSPINSVQQCEGEKTYTIDTSNWKKLPGKIS